MIESLDSLEQPLGSCDICVVGAGAVGLPLAVDLSQRGHSVILLEAGTDHVTAANQALMHVEQSGKPYRNPTLDRFRVLGGGTLFWGGQIFELGDHIINARPHVPAGTWPLPSGALRTHYDRAASLLGAQPDFEDGPVWSRVRRPPRELDNDLLQVVLSRWLPTRHFPKLFRMALSDNKNLRVVLNATVTGLGGTSKRITHLRASSPSGASTEISAKHFVIAAGAVENVRLLMQPLLSGAEPSWTANPSLGRYLTDHIGAVVGEFQPSGDDYRNYFETLYLDGQKYWPKLRLKPQKQIELGLLDAACEFAFENRLRTHVDNLRLLLGSLRNGVVPRGLGRTMFSFLGTIGATPALISRYLRDGRVGRVGSGSASVKVVLEQQPHPDSYVALSNEKDIFGMRKARVHWRVGTEELETLRFVADAARAYVDAHRLGEIAINDAIFEDDFLTRSGYDTIHQMGTTRMSEHADDGVVDSWGTVHGASNLHVAGASVFPSCGFANPTFAALALALRTGAKLSEALCEA